MGDFKSNKVLPRTQFPQWGIKVNSRLPRLPLLRANTHECTRTLHGRLLRFYQNRLRGSPVVFPSSFHMLLHTFKGVCVCLYIHTYVYICTCTCVYMPYIYIYIYVHLYVSIIKQNNIINKKTKGPKNHQ